MAEPYQDFVNPFQIRIAEDREPVSPIRVELIPSGDKPSIGLPGKQTGDWLLESSRPVSTLKISLGKAEKITAETFRRAGGAVARWCLQFHPPAIDVDPGTFNGNDLQTGLLPFCEGIYLGGFTFNRYKSSPNETANTQVIIRGIVDLAAYQQAMDKVSVTCTAVNMARDWAHEPANVINPISLSERAQSLAAVYGLKCTILDEEALKSMNAGGILSVGQGSKTPARMIILEYKGDGSDPNRRPIVLVGKAITFDSGGYSIKSTENIQGMKYDKSGGIVVASVLRAAAELKIKSPVIGIICAAENMVSAHSYRPDDIIKTLSGKTIEIISTDAEGRLVLADGLAYAQNTYHPEALIDLATLTGGVVVALGSIRAGILSNHDELARALAHSGEKVHERVWRLPLDDDYAQLIEGVDADIKNSGGREAAPVIGGIFLKQFVDDSVPWAHLDIAGVSDASKEQPYCPKGATGFGVRLLLDYLTSID